MEVIETSLRTFGGYVRAVKRLERRHGRDAVRECMHLAQRAVERDLEPKDIMGKEEQKEEQSISKQELKDLFLSLSDEGAQQKMREVISRAYQGDQETLQLLREFGVYLSAPVRIH